MHVVIETSKEQMKYLFSDCRQSPVADAAGLCPSGNMRRHGELEQSGWIWRRCSKPEMLLRAGSGAKPVDMEKILQTGKVA